MKIVAVAACTTGIAHIYGDVGDPAGSEEERHDVKVETQGAIEIETS